MRKVILLRGFIVVSGAAWAHHSYGATYNTKQEIKLEGKLVQSVPQSALVRAPRSTDTGGAMQRWAVEWAGTSQLANTGVTRESLKVGDQVVITARPSRVSGEYRVLMVRLTRPSDGFTWGSRGGEVVDRNCNSEFRMQNSAEEPPCRRRSRFACILHAAFCIVIVLSSTRRSTRSEAAPARRSGRHTRDGAALDLTGYWVSVITEDWRYRMVTPKSGVFDSIPLNGEGRKVGMRWDPARTKPPAKRAGPTPRPTSCGCRAACTSPGATRTPCRSRPDAGTQTRLLNFASATAAAAPSWQGHSVAQWEYAPGGGAVPRVSAT